MGLEPTTTEATTRSSTKLSYTHHSMNSEVGMRKSELMNNPTFINQLRKLECGSRN